jgi:hypothetical protein
MPMEDDVIRNLTPVEAVSPVQFGEIYKILEEVYAPRKPVFFACAVYTCIRIVF